MYTEALRIKQMKLGRESLEVARAKVYIADVCDSQGLHTESEALYVEVLQTEKLQAGGATRCRSLKSSPRSPTCRFSRRASRKQSRRTTKCCAYNG